jgi:integrase
LSFGIVSAETVARVDATLNVVPIPDAAAVADVKPVPLEDLQSTMMHAPKQISIMLQLMMFTGARPGEICAMTPGEIDRSQDVWIYRPSSHKRSEHGERRWIYLGPRSQAILYPRLAGKGESEPVFQTIADKRYSTAAFRREVQRAAKRAKVAKWSPNQVRHLVATLVASRFGRASESAFVGHSSDVADAVYIERDLPLAVRVAEEIG